MKIVMFTNTYLPHVGGVARSVSTFARDLQDLGYEVMVVCPHFSGTEAPPGQGPVPVVRVPAIQNFNGSDFSVRIPIPFSLSQQLDTFRPDLVHSHHPFLMGDTALRCSRQRKLPLVFTHHTLYERYTHYVPLDSDPMKRFVIKLSTEYANMCNRVIAPSRSVAELIKSRGVTKPIHEIPTGVDVDALASGDRENMRKALNIGPETLVIGHVGRLAPEKNLAFLGQSVARALEDIPDGVFVLTGDGPSLKTVQDEFDSRGLTERLITTGKKTGQELIDMYQAMDLFVFASTSETQGLVLAEAMAADNPVIALEATGTREVVRDGSNGLLLSGQATVDDFAAAITRWASEPEKRQAWSSAARETAWNFSRQRCAKSLADVYASVLSSFHPEASPFEDLQPWVTVLTSLKTEWDLISQKTSAFFSAVTPPQDK